MKPGVLHLIDSFRQGGSERQGLQLARLLKESGRYRVHVACLSSSGPLRDEVESLGLGEIPEYPLNSFYDVNAIAQLRRFGRHLNEMDIDILHTSDFYTNIFGMAAARFARVPVRIASRRESSKRTATRRMVERSAYRVAHAIVANCEDVRQQLIRDGVPNRKIVVNYNSLDIERVTPRLGIGRGEARAAFNLPAHRCVVTIVANLRPVKDHATFLRAAQRVRASVPEAAFVMAGEGESTESLRTLAARLELDRDVFFVGRCERVAELLAASDVCVLSSKSEGFSNSILEYMAAARPVVATNVGGAREAVVDGETGYLVPAEDYQEMAARIICLLRDPGLARAMGKRGRSRVEQQFSCEKQLERTKSLYDLLLAESWSTPPGYRVRRQRAQRGSRRVTEL